MSLRFYNTLSKKIEKFNPISKDIVKIYTCGPTVYDMAHIGNFRTFLFEDLLKRFLIYKGYNVYHVMNITDVDDKTIKRAKKDRKLFEELTSKYSKQFMEDIEYLKIFPADVYPRATDHIEEMIQMIVKLEKDGIAYLSKDNSIYYQLSKDDGYGRLINLNLSKLKSTDRMINDEYSKENPQDFSLWKSWDSEDGDIFWDSPWGKGRPGWHIECSAMSIKYLGEHFDIHCGGVDNIFPHHENELAQSVSATNKPFVNYWMHSEHLQLKGGKMSKTEGNFYTISDLKSKGYSPEEIRFVMLSAHYRTKLSFSIEQCLEARTAIQRIASLYNRLINIANGNLDKYNLPIEFQDFIKALDNDLDTPKALAIFFKWIRSINKKIDNNQAMNNKDINGSIQFLKIVDNIFGLLIKEDSPPDEIHSIAEEREVYRKAGDWEKADQLRDKIYSLGWVIEDKADGVSIKQKK
ncbi:MAG: cysteine--tRNA ligase [Candidatus Neomarinimicrobiota bacterium]|nr:cysteine--tRNA ligase [Candidatus Neomarinimicrobiota bacterium]